jgi:hypothetical protein
MHGEQVSLTATSPAVMGFQKERWLLHQHARMHSVHEKGVSWIDKQGRLSIESWLPQAKAGPLTGMEF